MVFLAASSIFQTESDIASDLSCTFKKSVMTRWRKEQAVNDRLLTLDDMEFHRFSFNLGFVHDLRQGQHLKDRHVVFDLAIS
jgi:hypothetical protein